MKIVQSSQLTTFREECRDWLADNVPREDRPHDGEAMRDFDLGWQAKQFEGGWAGINWPTEYGGRGLSVLEQLIWHEEYALAGGPPSGAMFVSLSHAGPTLIVAGTEKQKSKYLPTIL
ncbi:MAG: acyl-CoA dehydrogenase family protein, partial [Sphingomonadaceae bacterium]|nr:acyl-CoA dehydrogenase family protein [Sphingomonadaceae bacterium]